MRIIFKDMKIGLKHERVLNWIHPDANQQYNVNTDLEKIFTECTDSKVRFAQTVETFQVFTSIIFQYFILIHVVQTVMPMLAKRVDLVKVNDAMVQ